MFIADEGGWLRLGRLDHKVNVLLFGQIRILKQLRLVVDTVLRSEYELAWRASLLLHIAWSLGALRAPEAQELPAVFALHCLHLYLGNFLKF